MMLVAEILYCKVVQAEAHETRWLSSFLSYEGRGSMGAPTRLSLLNELQQKFPSGLIPLVVSGGAKAGVKVEVLDRRAQPVAVDPRADVDWLRDYQMEGLEYGISEHRGIFWHSTGAGKTEVMVALSLVLPCRWLVGVNRSSLMHQTAERFERRTGEPCGKVGDGHWNVQRVTVGMYQTLYADMQLLHPRFPWDSIQGFHADEVHGISSRTYTKVAHGLRNAYFRFGYSGTPLSRTDGKNLMVIASTGPVIHRIRSEDLVGDGVLAKPTVRMVRVAQVSKCWKYADAYDELIVDSQPRNQAAVAEIAKAEKPCLAFVVKVAHGKILEAMLRRQGISVEFTWGDKNTAQRDAALRRLVHGDIDVLITSVVFQEGIDCPELASVVNCGGGKSTIRCLQNLGRGTRRHDRQGNVTKVAFEVVDFNDCGCGCKRTLSDGTIHYKHVSCKWMDLHTQERRNAYLSEKIEVLMP